jgi:hypothetical protein
VSVDINDIIREQGTDAARKAMDANAKQYVPPEEKPSMWGSMPFTPEPDYEEKRSGQQNGGAKFEVVPLTVQQWLDRELPEPDRLLGSIFTTTSRVILNADTGIGKTNFALAAGAYMGANVDFLHWRSHRQASVVFVDGEMSNRLLSSRIKDVVRRLGKIPEGLHVLSHQVVEDFAPLNTPQGWEMINNIIQKIGRVDFIIFDNVMSLIHGEMKDEEAWAKTLPFVKDLTARDIGQLWVHHTGHDTTRGYGTKTRQWQMDTVIQANKVQRSDTDVSFTIEFHKARERTPENRREFEECTIALVNDEWITSGKTTKKEKMSPSNKKFLDALTNVYASGQTEMFDGRKVVRVEHWRAECERLGLVESEKVAGARAWFSKNKLQLIQANHIAAYFNQYVWKL